MGDANSEKNKQNEPHQNITKSTCKVHAIYQPPNQRPVKNHQPQQNVRLIKTTAQENTSNNHPGPIIPTSSTKFNKNNSSQPSSPKKSFLTTHQFLSQEINPKIDQEIIPSTTSIQALDGRQAGHSGANHQDLGWVHLACGRELPSTEATKVVAGLGCFTGEEGESWEQDLRGDLIRG